MKSSVTSHVIVRTKSARNMNAPLSTHHVHAVRMVDRDLARQAGHALLKCFLGDECLHNSTPPRTKRAAGTRLSGRAGKGNIAPDRETFSNDHRSRRTCARVRQHDHPGRRWSHPPLAHDTLRARRISVVREGTDPEAADLAPAATIRTVAISGDHTALALKAAIVQHLRGRGLAARPGNVQRSGGLSRYRRVCGRRCCARRG